MCVCLPIYYHHAPPRHQSSTVHSTSGCGPSFPQDKSTSDPSILACSASWGIASPGSALAIHFIFLPLEAPTRNLSQQLPPFSIHLFFRCTSAIITSSHDLNYLSNSFVTCLLLTANADSKKKWTIKPV